MGRNKIKLLFLVRTYLSNGQSAPSGGNTLTVCSAIDEVAVVNTIYQARPQFAFLSKSGGMQGKTPIAPQQRNRPMPRKNANCGRAWYIGPAPGKIRE